MMGMSKSSMSHLGGNEIRIWFLSKCDNEYLLLKRVNNFGGIVQAIDFVLPVISALFIGFLYWLQPND